MPTAQDFSLVITAHRAGPMLDRCLDSAARLEPSPRETIVAVDGADAAVVHAAESRRFRAIVCPDKPGVSATRNAGAEAAAGDIVAFADSDVELPPDFIAQAARQFSTTPDIAALIGSYDDAPAAPGVVSRYRNLLHHYTHQHGSREAQTFWSGCGAVRQQAFESVDGFDQDFREPSVEDIDLGYRLRAAGYRIRLEPRWQVKHLKKWRFHDMVFTDFFRRALPWSRLLRREGRLDNDLNIDRASRASAALVCSAAAALLAGLLWHLAFLVAALCLAATAMLNWKFYRFLACHGGWLFAASAIPLHLLYFLAASAGFALGRFGPSGVR